MDYLLNGLQVQRQTRMNYAARLARMKRELAAAQELFDSHRCPSYYKAVNRLTRAIARFQAYGYVSNLERAQSNGSEQQHRTR